MSVYKVDPEGVEALNSASRQASEVCEALISLLNSLTNASNGNPEGLGPHKAELAAAIERIRASTENSKAPAEEVCGALQKLAAKYQEMIDNNPFTISSPSPGAAAGSGVSTSSGGSESLNSSNIIKDLVDQNVETAHLPTAGHWENSRRPGDGDFVLADDVEFHWQKNGPHSRSGRELKNWMIENYGVSSVRYDHKEPDFSPFADKNIGTISVDSMSTSRDEKDGTYAYAEEVAARRMNCSATEVRQYMKDHELTWHECADRHTIIAVPTRINAVFTHSGGISVERSVKAMAMTISSQHDGAGMKLSRRSFTGNVSGLSDAISKQRKLFKKAKKDI